MFERAQSVEQSGTAPIEHMIVREPAAIDAGGGSPHL